MPPNRRSSTNSASNKPRNVSAQKKKLSRPRKVPKELDKIMSFCYYGNKFDEVFNGNVTPTVTNNSPPEPLMPLHVAFTDDTLFQSALPDLSSFHPVSDLDNAARVTTHYATEVSHDPFQYEIQAADTLSDNLCQSCGRYKNSDNLALIPLPSSTGSFSMNYQNQLSQHLFFDPNTHILQSTSYVPNAPTFTSMLYDNSHIETTATAGSSHLAMSSDGITLPSNNDAGDQPYYYM